MQGFTDEFEREAARFAERKSMGHVGGNRYGAGNLGKHAAALGTSVKSGGRDLAQRVKTQKSATTDVIKQRVKKLKADGKSSYKSAKSSIRAQSAVHMPLKGRNIGATQASGRTMLGIPEDFGRATPRSAPSSPTLGRRRASTSSGAGAIGADSDSVASTESSQSSKRYCFGGNCKKSGQSVYYFT